MRRRIPALLFLTVFLISCSQPAAETAKEPPKQYQLHGEVVRVDPQNKTATINAQKIEGWMEAMTMEFPVRESKEFEKLAPGRHITATVYVTDDGYWIGNIAVL